MRGLRQLLGRRARRWHALDAARLAADVVCAAADAALGAVLTGHWKQHERRLRSFRTHQFLRFSCAKENLDVA